MDKTAEYMRGYHNGFSLLRAYSLRVLINEIRDVRVTQETSAYLAGLVDAALAMVER